MSEPALKCENNASFKQIYTLKLFIAFKMAYSWYFSLGGKVDFPEFLQKKFYNINYWRYLVLSASSNGSVIGINIFAWITPLVPITST